MSRSDAQRARLNKTLEVGHRAVALGRDLADKFDEFVDAFEVNLERMVEEELAKLDAEPVDVDTANAYDAYDTFVESISLPEVRKAILRIPQVRDALAPRVVGLLRLWNPTGGRDTDPTWKDIVDRLNDVEGK